MKPTVVGLSKWNESVQKLKAGQVAGSVPLLHFMNDIWILINIVGASWWTLISLEVVSHPVDYEACALLILFFVSSLISSSRFYLFIPLSLHLQYLFEYYPKTLLVDNIKNRGSQNINSEISGVNGGSSPIPGPTQFPRVDLAVSTGLRAIAKYTSIYKVWLLGLKCLGTEDWSYMIQ